MEDKEHSQAMKRLLNTKKAAAICGLHPQTLVKMRNEYRGPAYVRIGRAIRYDPDEVARYLAANTVNPEEMTTPAGDPIVAAMGDGSRDQEPTRKNPATLHPSAPTATPRRNSRRTPKAS